MRSLLTITRTLSWLSFGAVLVLAGAVASAHEVAPAPIKAGEWYLTANASIENIRTPEYKALELYKDNSSFRGSGTPTNKYPAGFLLKRRIKENEFIPSVSFGYGIDGPGDMIFRVEFGVEAFNRKESYFRDRIEVPAGGFKVKGKKVGAFADFSGLDGNLLDGDDGIAYTGAVTDESLGFEEKSRGGHVSLYFDDRAGNLVYSRGVSVVYNYLDQDIDHRFFFIDAIGAGGLASRGDVRYDARYRSQSHSVGSRLHYSVGYEILNSISVFTMGRFGMFARYTRVKGRLEAPCIDTCEFLPVADFTPGREKKTIDDWKFAYEARMGFGASIRLGPIRVSGHAGGTRIGGWTTPRIDQGGLEVASSGGWGYFATASAGIAF